MEYLGALLKDTREKKGLSLSEVNKAIKIPVEILNNIESDRITTLNYAYLKGYLKIYSEYLGLDAVSILDAYKSLFPKPEIINLSPEYSRKKYKDMIKLPQINFVACLKVCVILFAVLALIMFIRNITSNKKIKNPAKETSAKTTDKKSPVLSKQQKTTVKTASSSRKKSGDIKLAIQAKEDTYIKVKADGRYLFQSVLRKGQSEDWTAKKEMQLFISRAGNVNLELNGKLLPSLGRKNQSIKNMVIKRDGSIQIE